MPGQLYAQYKFDKSILFNKDNGLPTNEVRAITRGENGFMWLGTSEGLCRFDGIHFKLYKPSAGNPRSLYSKEVNVVLPDKGQVWVGTSMGLSVLDIAADTFRSYQFTAGGKAPTLVRRGGMDVTAIRKDKTGTIWIGTRSFGACRYVPEKDDFIFYPYVPADTGRVIPGGYHTILSLEYSCRNDSIIWAGSLSGLLEINKYTGTVRNYFFWQRNVDYQTSLNAFRRLYCHDDGLLYAGSWRTGVSVYNPYDHSLIPLVPKDSEPMLRHSVSAIRRKGADEVWITTGGGLMVYNSRLKKISFRKENRLLENVFYGVEYVDEASRIWHNEFNGVQLFDPLMQQFRHESFEHLLIKDKWAFSFYMTYDTASQTIVVCPRFGDGLYCYHVPTRQWTHKRFMISARMPAPSLIVRGFSRQNEHLYTVSADEGLFSFSTKTGLFTRFAFQPKLEFRRHGDVLWDRKGRLWFCGDVDGLFCWDPNTKRHRVFKEVLGLGDVSAHMFTMGNMFNDSRNNIWLRRSGGFSVYIDEKDTLLNFLYRDDSTNSFPNVHAFTEDRQGRVWASSNNGAAGYALVNYPEAGIVQKMVWKPGNMYAEDEYSRLGTDQSGNIWGCSDKLLLKVNPDNFAVSTFDYGYGVENPEFFGFMVLPDDKLVLGGRSSIILANPHELRRNTEPPRPYLTGIEVKQLPYRGSISVFGKKPLHLGYRENFFSISFSAQAYSLGKEIRFRYRLQGFDDWVETTDRNFANYTNVPGGNYVFQLQAANNEGIWSKILSMPVTIEIAWWTTRWFFAAVVLLILAASWYLYKLRIRQVWQREYIRTEFEKKLANVEMSALRAQMNPHFLFNSLNSIDSYIIRNESKKASEYLNNFARLIRLILQNSRSNYISLKDELETLELYMQMESLRFKDKFQYELDVPENIDAATIDIPPMLIQPYVENAIWHGLMHQQNGKIGKVKVTIREKESMLLCIVEDNGIGRKRAMEIKSKKAGIAKRSMGMSITRDRMEIINKMYDTQTAVEITDLEDEEGKPVGTRVVLSIPV